MAKLFFEVRLGDKYDILSNFYPKNSEYSIRDMTEEHIDFLIDEILRLALCNNIEDLAVIGFTYRRQKLTYHSYTLSISVHSALAIERVIYYVNRAAFNLSIPVMLSAFYSEDEEYRLQDFNFNEDVEILSDDDCYESFRQEHGFFTNRESFKYMKRRTIS